MGYNGTSFGYYLGEEYISMLRICFKKIVVNDQVYLPDEFNQYLGDLREALFYLNDDIAVPSSEFGGCQENSFISEFEEIFYIHYSHVNNPNVRIGQTHEFAIMIYCAKTDSTGQIYDPIEWDDVLFMKAWKEKLTMEGRIPNDVKLSLKA